MVTTEYTAQDIALWRASEAYCERLKEAGLWDCDAREHMTRHAEKWAIQTQVTADFPDAGLGIFDLDKAETRGHAEELAEQWIEEHSGMEDLTAQEFWHEVWARPNHDRDNPNLLLTLAEESCFTDAALIELVADVWVSTEFPGGNGGIERWSDVFQQVGWVSDDGSAPPTEPLTLYRGASPSHARGMSWTADWERAVWFAKRFSGLGETALVYRRTFAPTDILGRFTGRNEDEYIVYIDPADDTELDWAEVPVAE